jgi:hypothetical protein
VLNLLADKISRFSHEVINKGVDTGKVINVATGDLDLFEVIFMLNSFWFSPLFLIIIIIVIYFISGVGGIFGVLAI